MQLVKLIYLLNVLKIKTCCKVSKNVEFNQNLSNIPKFNINITTNATFIKNPLDVLGNCDTLTFKWLSPYKNTPSTANTRIVTNNVNQFDGFYLWAGADVEMRPSNL